MASTLNTAADVADDNVLEESAARIRSLLGVTDDDKERRCRRAIHNAQQAGCNCALPNCGNVRMKQLSPRILSELFCAIRSAGLPIRKTGQIGEPPPRKDVAA
jgi:hypothetical protein